MSSYGDNNSQKVIDIEETYLYRSVGKNRFSIKFSYEEDNPSYIFYREHILKIKNKKDTEYDNTTYIKNLKNSTEYFTKKLSSYTLDDLEELLMKITHQLKFNIHEINKGDELDEHVIFETLNNRGKDLSTLEILKNRLMYLTTQFIGKTAKDFSDLRKDIHSSWVTIYQYLGKDSLKKIHDDRFLKDHWQMYWGKPNKNKEKQNEKHFLLNEFFIAKKVLITSKQRENYSAILEDRAKLENEIKKAKLFFNEDKIDKLRDSLKKIFMVIYEIQTILHEYDEELEDCLHFFKDGCTKNNCKEDVEEAICDVDKNPYMLEIYTINFLKEVDKLIETEIYPNYLNDIMIKEYSKNIDESIISYYYILNPSTSEFNGSIKKYLVKLNKLDVGSFISTLLPLFNKIKDIDNKKVVTILKLLEKYIFVKKHLGSKAQNKIEDLSYELACTFNKTNNIDMFLSELENSIIDTNGNIKIFKFDYFEQKISNLFNVEEDKNGFYSWSGLEYVLWEYELHLRQSKDNKGKASSDKYSIEHIYPTNPNKKEWRGFDSLSSEAKHNVNNSIGNLLIMSLKRNKELQNFEFDKKKDSYKNGNYAEVEVSNKAVWNKDSIQVRAIKIISFVNDRWSLGMNEEQISQIAYFE